MNERFALFFPEKRPFFLEGIELFGSPQTLVYTRRIVDPKAGAKLTGKFGQLGVAHLTAVDDTEAGDAWFNITRLRRDFGTNSIAGVTFTNRDATGAYNRVLAADFRYVWSLYYTQFQYGRSWTSDAAGSRDAPIWQAEFDRTGRTWGFNYLLKGQGEGFDAQAGFVNRLRSNVVFGQAFNRLTHYGSRGALLENLTVFFGPGTDLVVPGFRVRAGARGTRPVGRHLPAARRVGAERPPGPKLRALPGQQLCRLHRRERHRTSVSGRGEVLRPRVADQGNHADLAAARGGPALSDGARRRSSRRGPPAPAGS